MNHWQEFQKAVEDWVKKRNENEHLHPELPRVEFNPQLRTGCAVLRIESGKPKKWLVLSFDTTTGPYAYLQVNGESRYRFETDDGKPVFTKDGRRLTPQGAAEEILTPFLFDPN